MWHNGHHSNVFLDYVKQHQDNLQETAKGQTLPFYHAVVLASGRQGLFTSYSLAKDQMQLHIDDMVKTQGLLTPTSAFLHTSHTITHPAEFNRKNYLQSQIFSLVTELHFIFKFLFPCHQSKMTIINKFNKNKMPLFSSSPKEGIKVILLLKLLSKEKGGRNSHFFFISYSNVKKNISSSLYEANISTASLIYSHFSRLTYKESTEASQERKKKVRPQTKHTAFF